MCDCKISFGSGATVTLKAEFVQTFDHHLRVLAPERAQQGGFTTRQGARINARSVMLLEPGTVISPSPAS